MIKPKNFWMPSYLCECVIHKDYNVKFYKINCDLSIDKSFIKNIKNNDLVLIINYFGQKIETEIFDEIKEKKAFSIEDAAQALFSDGNQADFTVYSLTKMIGIPDGAILKSKNQFTFNLKKPPIKKIYKNIEYRFIKKMFDGGYKVDWYTKYLEYKKESTDVGLYQISEFSKTLLEFVNLEKIREKNIENFNYLSKFITPLIKITKNDVPSCFPIKVKICQREKILNKLILNKIYPSVHWNLSKVPKKFKESYKLSNSELTLPCDWRYSEFHMQRIIKIFKQIMDNI